MALINRISRLFRADMHALLDRLEEPDLLLRQAIRDMESTCHEEQQQRHWLQQEQARLDERLQRCRTRLANMEQELDTCFQSNQEVLARQLIRKQLELTCLTEQLGNRRDAQHQRLSDIGRRLDEHHNRLEGLRQKVQLLAPEPADEDADKPCEPDPIHIDDADVEIAFLRAKQQRSHS